MDEGNNFLTVLTDASSVSQQMAILTDQNVSIKVRMKSRITNPPFFR